MEKFDEFDLLLKGMPAGEQTFSYHIGDDFFRKMESADVSAGEAQVQLAVKHIGAAYELAFAVRGEISIPCDRCLDPMVHRFDTTYTMRVCYGDDYSEGDDMVVLPEREPAFNVARTIYDTVMLTIPLQHYHEPGGCNEAMSQLLAQHQAGSDGGDDDDGYTDPRWEALRQFREN